MKKFLLGLLCPFAVLCADNLAIESPCEQLFRDLEIVEKINKEIHDHLPLLINYNLQGGYFNMPSARTYDAGVLGFGFAYVPPYRIWSLGFQFFDHIETTGNYWIFQGIIDSTLGHLGFGEEAERAANFKVILLRKEDGFPFIPDIALGMNDFLGTCRFKSFYLVATQELLKLNLEASLGWGSGRIHGFFGGLGWTPFRHSSHFWKGLTLSAEYDANDYKHHPFEHHGGRSVKNRVNVGAQLDLWELFRLSASTIRGEDWAASLAFRYNLGASKGLFPKLYDAAPYTAPVNTEPLGPLRSQQELAQEVAYALREQGFDLYNLSLIPEKEGKDRLWMQIVNVRYREEGEVRRRIETVLSALSPSNVQTVTAVIEAEGVPVHEYRYRIEDLKRYREGQLGEPESRVIAPLREATSAPSKYESTLLYKRSKPIWLITFRPWARTFLGSSRGKFKYEVGLGLGPEGYLFNQIYYYLWMTYTAKSSAKDIGSQDTINPSKIINVRTDSILYNQSNSLHVDQAFLQKSWNMGQGWFSRLGVGYFETAYGGAALEALYYPVHFNWALGFETAALFKRKYYGLGFSRTIRKLTGEGPIYVPYVGWQYFVNFYYQFKPLNLDFKVNLGQFLAYDKGIRVEGGRTFASGLRVGLWYTMTNAGDIVNGSRYYDKGFSITLPLDIFLNKSSRTRIGYSMSAWLRDCGAVGSTGKQLYPTIYWERYNGKPVIAP